MKKILYLLLLFLPGLSVAQSPWARNKAGFYAQAAYSFISTYGSIFGAKGKNVVLDHLVSERQIQMYGEYGLTKKSTLVLSLPFVFNERGASNPESSLMFAQENTGKIAGLGNASLALRHQFRKDKVAFAGTVKVGFPSGKNSKPLTDLRTGYNAYTVQPMVSIGIGSRRTYGFLYASTGYRSKQYSDFFQLGGEAGVHLGKLWLIGFSDFLYSLKNGTQTLPSIDVLTGLYANDQEWFSVGAKVSWEINRFWGVNLSAASAVWAQNVPQSPGFGVSAYFKWE